MNDSDPQPLPSASLLHAFKPLILFLIVVCIAFASAVNFITKAVRLESEQLITANQNIIEGLVSQHLVALGDWTYDFASWQEAYNKVVVQSDRAWINDNLAFLYEGTGATINAAYDQHNRPLYLFIKDQTSTAPVLEQHPELAIMFERARQAPVIDLIPEVGTLLLIGQPHLVAVHPFTPLDPPSDWQRQGNYNAVILIAKPLGDSFLYNLSENFNIRQPNWSSQSCLQLDKPCVAFTGPDHRHSFSIHFEPPVAGEKILEAMQLPRAITALSIVAAAILGFLHGLKDYRALRRHSQQLRHEIELRTAAEQQQKKLANTDELTGLPNRRSFTLLLKQKIAEEQRHGEGLALVFLDLDGFKQVNDQMGHDAGDELLSLVAQRLKTAFRESDIVARFGGDEFCILLSRVSDPASLTRLLNDTISKLEKPCQLQAGSARISCSMGVALHSQSISSSDQLINRADAAMYQAKQLGKGRFVFA